MKRGSKNSDSDATKTKSSKRPREEEQTAPQYGSKEYWEARYKSHLTDAKVDTNTANTDKRNTTNESANNDDAQYVLDGIELSKDAINPGHAWYFSYEELRPLILPLILGSEEESEAEELESNCDDSDSWIEEEEEVDEGGEQDEIENDEIELDGDLGEEEEDERAEKHPDADECADDAEGHDSNDILIAKQTSLPDKPKKVMEVGCGDVALGVELAADLVKMQGAEAALVVDEICCIDYSDVVVKTLIDKQKEEHNGSSLSTLQASFYSLDARSLPQAPNTFDLVLEKGTLDAMLSDKDEGVKNCIQIVKEMARVTNVGGSILIVSHLNANESKGMTWLEDVVFSGLEAEFKDRREATKGEQAQYYVWSIQIHGGEGQLINDEDGEEVMTYGPAVYIIRKKSVSPTKAQELFSRRKKKDTDNDATSENGDETEFTMPPVKVEFLTYD